MFDVPTGIESVIGDHEKAIKCVVHNPVDSKYQGNDKRREGQRRNRAQK